MFGNILEEGWINSKEDNLFFFLLNSVINLSVIQNIHVSAEPKIHTVLTIIYCSLLWFLVFGYNFGLSKTDEIMPCFALIDAKTLIEFSS